MHLALIALLLMIAFPALARFVGRIAAVVLAIVGMAPKSGMKLDARLTLGVGTGANHATNCGDENGRRG
jgi:hypothetical protein